ncbi:MAG: hypothetical protein ABJC60_06270 [Actinomycetota bacterium]
MAIKGKGKTKSRPSARAPRPEPVVRKPPFFVRRWVQFVAGALLGMGAVMVVVWATNGLRSSHADEARTLRDANARRIVQEWQTTVEGMIATIGTPGTTGGPPAILPSLSASVATLAKGDPDKTAQDTATMAIGLTSDADATLAGVDLPALISANGALDLATTNYVLNSKARMMDGLELYAQVAKLVKTAVTSDDPAVTEASIAEAGTLLPIAARVFQEGYADYTEARAAVGLLQAPPGLSGLSGAPSG